MSHLRQLGFELPPDAASRYGLGAAVGNIEVSLLELVRAFSAFPRGGTLPELVFLEDGGAGAAGRGAGSLAVQKRSGARVYDPGTAWLVVSMLSDPSARSTGFGTRTYFRTSFPAMFKSGTSSEFTNLWCLGATPAYTVGVWAGNFDGRAVINKTGSIVPAQIVVDTLKRLSAAPGDFTRPAGVVAARICALTGRGATDRCPSARTEYFRTPQDVPPPCTYHTSGAGREELLPESILAEGPRPVILHPLEGQLFFFDETLQGAVQRIPVLIGVPRGERISVSLDGGPETEASGRFTIPARRGRHSILVRCPGGRSSVSFEVR
jgi:penicillin-binding protein 1C